MGDSEEAVDAIGGVQDEQSAQPDPAQQLDSDAWLAQFQSENAEKLAAHNRQAIDETEAEIAAAQAREKLELGIAHRHHGDAEALRGVAGDYENREAREPWRRDELEDQAQQARRHAEKEDQLAAKAEAAAADADATAKRLDAEDIELYGIAAEHDTIARLRHDQARALERAAADDRKVQALTKPAGEDTGP
jgi:hypothetical protein